MRRGGKRTSRDEDIEGGGAEERGAHHTLLDGPEGDGDVVRGGHAHRGALPRALAQILLDGDHAVCQQAYQQQHQRYFESPNHRVRLSLQK